ncbi:hypothetical protein EUX98_g8502 [Antrodiella citrinella]|uniref:Uncharacterized protein n=1 Tax=Antrodiella citrinella TaxID=2447956 RepID=A0A4S4M7Z4_9APHY|nr:hypothetical protein EUX98_g8502 [Antrodiella citrinella]
MDALGYDYACGEVLVGPAADCVEFGGMPQYLTDGTELWDDVLSQAELDLICGVYAPPEGESSKPSKTICLLTKRSDHPQEFSWWPKTTVWRGCGLDVGYWSIDCETWYTVRRDAILANDNKVGRLRNSTQWRNSLKFVRKRSQLVLSETRAFSNALLH